MYAWTVYLIIFSMLLSPELGIGATAGDRPVAIRFEDILLILVGFAWLARSAYQKDLGLIRSSPLNWPIAAYTLAAILATLVSGWLNQIDWLRALLFLAKYVEYFVLYFLVLSTVRNRTDIRNYLIAAFVTCVIVSIVGIAQIPDGHRVSAPFEGGIGEPNTFGGLPRLHAGLWHPVLFDGHFPSRTRLVDRHGTAHDPSIALYALEKLLAGGGRDGPDLTLAVSQEGPVAGGRGDSISAVSGGPTPPGRRTNGVYS